MTALPLRRSNPRRPWRDFHLRPEDGQARCLLEQLSQWAAERVGVLIIIQLFATLILLLLDLGGHY